MIVDFTDVIDASVLFFFESINVYLKVQNLM